MKVQVLGSGAAWPFPRFQCECPMCKEARTDASLARSRTALWIDERILLDAGPDVYRLIALHAPLAVRQIKALFLSHVHCDHYLGLDDLSHIRRHAPLPIYLPPDNISRLKATFGHLCNNKGYTLREIVPGQVVEIDGVRVMAFDAHHTSDFTTYGYSFERAERKLVIGTDVGNWNDAPLKDTDLLLADGSTWGGKVTTHIPMQMTLQVTQAERVARTIFTHIGHVRLSYADLGALVKSHGGTGVARDGEVFEV